MVKELAEDLYERGEIDIRETFIDGSFSPAKKGVVLSAIRNAGKAPRSWQLQTLLVFLSPLMSKAPLPHEVKLVDKTIDNRFLDKTPNLLIGDKAYDSDPLDQRLKEDKGIELVAPHKRNRKKPKTQDGRKLRCYRRRWKVERLFAWLHNFRRLPIRYEYHADNFLGMIQLGCAIILMRLF